MELNEVKKYMKMLSLDKSIDLKDIPDIDLYMDQLITLFEHKLSDTKRYPEDKLLTKTMINNYTKDKVIMPAVKKKYTKDHIMLMILLYQFKNIISIGDIKLLFSLLKTEEVIDDKKLIHLFEGYQKMKAKELEGFDQFLDKRWEETRTEVELMGISKEEQSDIEKILFICSSLEQAYYHKKLAEKMIDEFIKE